MVTVRMTLFLSSSCVGDVAENCNRCVFMLDLSGFTVQDIQFFDTRLRESVMVENAIYSN